MSNNYQAVGWNRQKKIYDTLMLGGVLAFLITFIALGAVLRPNISLETLLIRAFGAAAITLLHIILCIGPICRMDVRFLPLLYNRRHMGVTMFILALAHGGLSIMQYHAFGDMHPIVSVFTGNGGFDAPLHFPFQPFGFAALMILFLMAATSHDFWLANLSAPVWKLLHMGVYLAYVLLVVHVAMGYLQTETHPAPMVLLLIGILVVSFLHVHAFFRARSFKPNEVIDGYLVICGVDDIPMNRAKIATINGERVAVFRHEKGISAVSNVCQHQNGPLGEGAVIDGCITCPWHGYQYNPENGASPKPFTEKVPTFKVKVAQNMVLVHPTPNLPGTHVPAAPVRSDDHENG